MVPTKNFPFTSDSRSLKSIAQQQFQRAPHLRALALEVLVPCHHDVFHVFRRVHGDDAAAEHRVVDFAVAARAEVDAVGLLGEIHCAVLRLARAGIDLADTASRIPVERYALLYNLCIEALDDEAFGLLPEPMRPGSFEFLCRAMLGAPTLGEALARALQDFVKQTVAPYKYPRAVEFTDKLPRTQTGKLQRFKLHEAP